MLTFVLITSAALSANLGVVLTALDGAPRAHRAVAARRAARQTWSSGPLWRLAAGLDLGGWALKTAALLVAPLTVVAPAMALGLFVLVVFSAIVLKEKPRVPALIGIALLAGGVALVALHSPPREVSIAGPLPWLICAGLLLAGALWVFVARARGAHRSTCALMALSCGCAWALNGILSKLMADSIDTSRWALLALALSSAFTVGALGYLAKTSALQAGEATTVESIVGVVNTLVPGRARAGPLRRGLAHRARAGRPAHGRAWSWWGSASAC